MNIYIKYLKDKLDYIFKGKGEDYVISKKVLDMNISIGLYRIVWDENYKYDNFIPTVINLEKLESDEFKIFTGKYIINGSSYYSSEIIFFKKELIRNKQIEQLLKWKKYLNIKALKNS